MINVPTSPRAFSPRAFRQLLVAALVALCSCRPSEASTGVPATRTTLQLDWVAEPEFGGFYAAQLQGAFRAEGLDVDIQGGGAGVPVVQLVASGKVDFGIAGGDEVIVARARGADVVPVFAVFQTSPQGIMVHASRGASSLAEVLAQGTLAIEPGLSYALFLKKKYGFDRVKVVPYDGGVARFLSDPTFAQQCFVTSEPLAARKRGSDPKVFLLADEGFNPYLGVVIARAALVREDPQRVKRFVRAARDGWRAYLDNPEPANVRMAKLNSSMDAETFAAAARAEKPLIEAGDGKALGAMTHARWQKLAEQMQDLGLVGAVTVPNVEEGE